MNRQAIMSDGSFALFKNNIFSIRAKTITYRLISYICADSD